MAPMPTRQNHAGHRTQAVVRFLRTPRHRADDTVRSSVRIQTAPHASHQASGRMVENRMTKKQLNDVALDELRRIQKDDDYERAHAEADDSLCALLTALGFSEVVSEYGKIRKHYA